MSQVALITQFIVDEFLPDVSPADLEPDYDLLANGVIDSLGLLKVVAWLEDRFGLAIEDVEFRPDDLRTVTAIDTFLNDNGDTTNGVHTNGPAEAAVF